MTSISEWGIFPPSTGGASGASPAAPSAVEDRACSAGPFIIAGPCSAESREQILTTAGDLRNAGVSVFRAGIWKPRTHPGFFEGVGAPGLVWLSEVKKELGMKVCCEVASGSHVEECLAAGVDMLWIGARTTVNPFMVQEIARALSGCDIPVLVKNPTSPDLDLWTGALERLQSCGLTKLGAVLRGVSVFNKLKYRNEPSWEMAIKLRGLFPHLPIFCDPSHMAGDRHFVAELSQRALDLGFDGLMVEAHANPSLALSDPAQQLTPAELQSMLSSLSLRSASASDSAFTGTMGSLREQIDIVDEQLLALFTERMELSRRIGELKKEYKVAIVQSSRWEEVLGRMISAGISAGLSEKFIRAVFTAIHEESISVQEKD